MEGEQDSERGSDANLGLNAKLSRQVARQGQHGVSVISSVGQPAGLADHSPNDASHNCQTQPNRPRLLRVRLVLSNFQFSHR